MGVEADMPLLAIGFFHSTQDAVWAALGACKASSVRQRGETLLCVDME